MTTMQNLVSTYRKVHRWDITAGKLFGNADHVHLAGESGVSYALALGFKTVLVGTTAALLFLMLLFVISTGNPVCIALGVFGWALTIYQLARSFYSLASGGFVMALVVILGFVPLIAFGASSAGMLSGLAFNQVFSVAWDAALIPLSMAFGLMLAGYVVETLGRTILRAFAAPPKHHRPKFKLLKSLGVLTDDEIKAVRNLKLRSIVSCAISLPLIAIGFLLIIASWQASIAAWIAGLLCLFVTVVLTGQLDRLHKATVSRLEREGVLEIDQIEIETLTIEVARHGFRLDGMFYPGDTHEA